MALSINPNILETLQTTAGAKAALIAAQHASVPMVQAAQRIFQAAAFLDSIFGTPFEDQPNPLMGYLTPKQVLEMQRSVRALAPSRKNLFFLRITDESPPDLGEGLSNAPYWMLDLLAIEVSYGPRTTTGDKIPVGSAAMDKVTGTDATEVQITTYDDERGSLKRWFDAKSEAMAATDGSFGLPKDYCVDLEVIHGIPSPLVDDAYVVKAYKSHVRMRPVSITHEVSRRDQALQELQMTFTQFDTWVASKKP